MYQQLTLLSSSFCVHSCRVEQRGRSCCITAIKNAEWSYEILQLELNGFLILLLLCLFLWEVGGWDREAYCCFLVSPPGVSPALQGRIPAQGLLIAMPEGYWVTSEQVTCSQGSATAPHTSLPCSADFSTPFRTECTTWKISCLPALLL